MIDFPCETGHWCFVISVNQVTELVSSKEILKIQDMI